MSKSEFLNFPVEEHCTGVFSLGEPGGGKTYLMLKCINEWLNMGIFAEFHLVLPSYRNEMEQSYKGLADIKNVFVYEKYREKQAKELIDKANKNAEEFKAGKIKQRTKYFFAVDDATSQGKELMQCPYIKRIATEGRHLFIQSWFCLHHTANIIPPAVRGQTKFTIFYNMHQVALKTCWKEYINFSEFRKWNDFIEFWDSYVINKDHGCLLVLKNKSYNPNVSSWFD